MHYYELEPEENTFHTLLVDITHRCPLSCANCYIPNRDIPDMDVEKLYDLLDRLPKRTYIRLMGAEATMRNDLPEIISKVKSSGHRVSILTAGLRLKNIEYCQKLWDSGLRSLGLSLNGGDDENIYEIMDGSKKFTWPKIEALKNCFQIGFVVHVNCIIAKNVNEHMIRDLPILVTYWAKKYNKKFSPIKYPIMLRFKNIGAIGNYMEDSTLTMKEIALLFEKYHQIDHNFIMSQNMVEGYNECTSSIFNLPTDNGDLLIKITDWMVDESGVPDPNSQRRGRVTENFKIAPFFEHVKQNENGY